jgi:DNA-binding NtrC family response regulator
MPQAILLVFNETQFLEKLKEKLRWFRSPLLTAANLKELEEVCSSRVIDVALLDVRHKNSDPLGMLAVLKQKQPGAQVILVSSQENIVMAMEGMQHGAADEILVPFDVGSLKQKVKAALATKKAMDRNKNKSSFRRAFENAMVAVTFAQAGEYETARESLRDERREDGGKQHGDA